MIQKIGVLITTIGWIAAFLIVSTDDFYTIELREYHVIDWKALFISLAVSVIGVVIYRAGELLEQSGGGRHDDL